METIATYSKPEEAHLVRMRLESVGIEATVLDENMAQLEQPVLSGTGGVRLQVAEGEVKAALALLREDLGVAKSESQAEGQ